MEVKIHGVYKQFKVDKEKYPNIKQEYRLELQNIKSVKEK